MIDIKELEENREKACEDKCDLFDFYNDNWETVLDELQRVYAETGRKPNCPYKSHHYTCTCEGMGGDR